jgi:hypothetical protein
MAVVELLWRGGTETSQHHSVLHNRTNGLIHSAGISPNAVQELAPLQYGGRVDLQISGKMLPETSL